MARRSALVIGSITILLLFIGVIGSKAAHANLKNDDQTSYSVAIAGAGPGGLTVAMELIERGFNVSVYEAMDILGGKARSVGVPNSGSGGRPDLPGEHGFRIVFGFYKHLVDTLQRVPFNGTSSIYDQLEPVETVAMYQENYTKVGIPASPPDSVKTFEDLVKFLAALADGQVDIPISEQVYFLERLGLLVGSCEKRWDTQYDNFTYWNFFHADEHSPGYQKIFIQGPTRVIQGLPAKEASLRASGRTLIRMFESMSRPGGVIWRLLNGPTNDVWINPMVQYLQAKGVKFYKSTPLTQILFDGRKITGFVVNQNGNPVTVTADFYVSSIPVEKLEPLITPQMIQAAPSLATMPELKNKVKWMNGIQFFYTKDFPVNPGHMAFLDSKWALTGISQPQYWPNFPVDKFGDGNVNGIISIDISDWTTPGEVDGPSQGKAAQDCTREEVEQEVYFQVGKHLGMEEAFDPSQKFLYTTYLDRDISFTSNGTTNLEPLFIASVKSYILLPPAATEIPNFFLGSDYVKGETGFASMEGANEAARNAVNGILKAVGRTDYCQLFQFAWPDGIEWQAARDADCALYDAGYMPIGW